LDDTLKNFSKKTKQSPLSPKLQDINTDKLSMPAATKNKIRVSPIKTQNLMRATKMDAVASQRSDNYQLMEDKAKGTSGTFKSTTQRGPFKPSTLANQEFRSNSDFKPRAIISDEEVSPELVERSFQDFLKHK